MDTSVWIDHFRAPEAELRDRLDAGEVLMHKTTDDDEPREDLPVTDKDPA